MLKVWSSWFFWLQISRSRCFAEWCPSKALTISLSSISEWKRVLIEGLVDACCKAMAMLVKMKGEGLGQGHSTKLCEGPTIYNFSLRNVWISNYHNKLPFSA